MRLPYNIQANKIYLIKRYNKSYFKIYQFLRSSCIKADYDDKCVIFHFSDLTIGAVEIILKYRFNEHLTEKDE